MVCRELATEDATGELRDIFGAEFDQLKPISQQTLNLILLAEKYSRAGGLNAKQVSRLLKHRLPGEYQQRGEDEFYRAIRYSIERLAPDKKMLNLETQEWHSVPDKMLSILGPRTAPRSESTEATKRP